ncbi:hypothetical protein Q1695_000328 [Nippostrongylus brasiliensis]|nr:hypothetical protein Q1695_000328 [Nippostrongylus brasiliensis]
MSVPKERCLSPHTFGVYPNHHKWPSSLCCFRIMQLRTGVLWLAYGEMVWITSQLSYWAAQTVTNGFSEVTILFGFLFTFLQIVFVLLLVKGVKQFRSSFIACYLCGLAARTLLYIGFLALTAVTNWAVEWRDDTETLKFFRTKVGIKVAICIFYTVLKIYCFVTVYRYFVFIQKTKEYLDDGMDRQLSVVRQSKNKWRTITVEESTLQS